eukprot:Amastigsp_a174491_449.p3 type:complete len:221 gc:universal Amastigsp_a174491_449:700-38(-)
MVQLVAQHQDPRPLHGGLAVRCVPAVLSRNGSADRAVLSRLLDEHGLQPRVLAAVLPVDVHHIAGQQSRLDVQLHARARVDHACARARPVLRQRHVHPGHMHCVAVLHGQRLRRVPHDRRLQSAVHGRGRVHKALRPRLVLLLVPLPGSVQVDQDKGHHHRRVRGGRRVHHWRRRRRSRLDEEAHKGHCRRQCLARRARQGESVGQGKEARSVRRLVCSS